MKIDLHNHSYYSDGFLSPREVVKLASKANCSLFSLTDHDTIRGSLLLRNKVKKLKLDVEVPLCAEYKTSHGDLIAAYIQREIKNMELNNFIDEVRSQNGIILFPHPYVGHKNIEEIISKVDAVEIFNGRSNENDDINAYKLAKKHKN